ncbi:MAG: hypothetical protein KDB96_13675, partial [Flavobacteriales bacterium]|nr:hypothetical protein [Flavobacteriales bacterium]
HHTCGYNNYQPRTGEGYAGIIFYDPTGYREYITALLAQPMEPGQCYYVEFWVALSTGSIMAIDEVQVHFSTGVPLDLTFPPPGPLPLTPHLQAASAPTSHSYQQVCGLYTATGGENAMTFGNFRDNAGTTLTQVGNVGGVQAYYYIDDVRVSPLELGPDPVVCDGDTAVLVSNVQCPQMTYAWSTGDTGFSTGTTVGGPVSLTLSGNGSCTASDTVLITVRPEPEAGTGGTDTLCTDAGSTDLFTLLGGTPTPGGTWTDPGQLVFTGIVDPSTAPDGTYSYVVSGDGICPDDTASLELVFEPCLGIGEHDVAGTMAWLGQDGSGIHHFRVPGTGANERVFIVVDAAGRAVSAPTRITPTEIWLDLSTRPAGMYVLHVQGPGGATAIPFLHERR